MEKLLQGNENIVSELCFLRVFVWDTGRAIYCDGSHLLIDTDYHGCYNPEFDTCKIKKRLDPLIYKGSGVFVFWPI